MKRIFFMPIFAFSERAPSYSKFLETSLKSLEGIDLKYNLKNWNHNMKQISKFNDFVFKNPVLFLSNWNANPLLSKFSNSWELFQKNLIGNLQNNFLTARDISSIYRFLLILQKESADPYLENIDRLLIKMNSGFDQEHALELFWLNCLRTPQNRNSSLPFIDFFRRRLPSRDRDFEKVQKNPLIKAMLSQITNFYPNEIKLKIEEVAIINPIIMRRLYEFKRFLGSETKLKELDWIHGFLVPLLNQEEKIAFEIVDFNEKKPEMLINHKIRIEFLKEKGMTVKILFYEVKENGKDILIEMNPY